MKNVKVIGKALLIAALVASSAQMFASDKPKQPTTSPSSLFYGKHMRKYKKDMAEYKAKERRKHEKMLAEDKAMQESAARPLTPPSMTRRDLLPSKTVAVPNIYDRTMGKLSTEQQVGVIVGAALVSYSLYKAGQRVIGWVKSKYPSAAKKAKELMHDEEAREALGM